jgi:hypothetical protein
LSQYRDLKDFFVGILKVKIQDLDMLVDELSLVVSSNHTVDDVKNLIWQINSLRPSRTALEKLEKISVFPVRKARIEQDSVVLQSRTEKFSIIDRQLWAEVFQDRIDFLDFTLEEVRKLNPFLASFDLEDRYPSRTITETSYVQGEVQVNSKERTGQLRSRAHALAR